LVRAVDNRTRYGKKKEYERFVEIVSEILNVRKIKCDPQEVADDIWRMLVRRSRAMDGIDVSNLDIELVKADDPLGWMPKYTSGACGIGTFDEIRDIIGNREFMSFEELRGLLHKMRQDGKPINNRKEYVVWIKNGCDYSFVEKYRRNGNGK
jgi:hypothetical protein